MSILATITLAAAPAPAAAAQPAPTLQQQFEAATDAMMASKCTEAVPLFEALERNPGVKAGSIPAAAIAVRKGTCLIRISRVGEGEASVRAGLPRLERAGEQYSADVAKGYFALGNAALIRTDYAEARRQLEKSLGMEKGSERIPALSLLSRAAAFDPGPEPLAYAEEALRLVETAPKPSKDLLAQLHSLHARILLNRGQTAEAFAELKTALQLSGGLTSRTTMAEASLRGDLALAALLLGKKDEARRYLAWTGAGRISQSPFASGVVMDAPECGGEAGLKPEDFAVVEFGIGDNGQVAYAEAAHSKGGPKVAAAFANAVRGWYWRPDLLAKIPAFYRATTRIELRCSVAGGGVPEAGAPLRERFVQWATPFAPVDPGPSPAARVAALKAAATEKQGQGDVRGQVAAAGLLALYTPAPDAETVAIIDRALAASPRPDVPAEAINALRVMRIPAAAIAGWGDPGRRARPPAPEDYLALLQDPVFAADAVASGVVLLTAASPRADRRERDEAGSWLKRVADDGRLPEHHPLRQVARIKLANRAAAAGDLAGAQTYFLATGLTEQQCALIGATPSLKRSGADSGDFPMEAMQYGFEGWVKLEFDIQPDGKAASVRPIAAYPPFVFVEAAQGMSRGFRYESSYRPSGGPACSAKQEIVRFILP